MSDLPYIVSPTTRQQIAIKVGKKGIALVIPVERVLMTEVKVDLSESGTEAMIEGLKQALEKFREMSQGTTTVP